MATVKDQGDISRKSQNDAQAFFESQQNKYKRAKDLVCLLTEGGRLDKSINNTIGELLQEERKLAGYETPFEHVTDLQFSLPLYDFVLDADFYKSYRSVAFSWNDVSNCTVLTLWMRKKRN